uniref:Enhancer of mRNA-decapping protein 3 n=1 Tax=Cyprinus carpio TaxID=7962 RepID=A0A8C1I945_CYPCA
MAADWVGCLVSINCGPTLGVYQGEVSSVDQTSQTISLRHPFHNGVKCTVPEVTFSAMDIKDLKILEIRKSSTEVPKLNGSDTNSTLTPQGGRKDKGGGGAPVNSTPVMVPNKTEPKTQEGGVSPVPHYSKSYGERHMDMAVQSKGFRRRHNSWSSSCRGPNQATPKKNGLKNGGNMKNRDDECFGDGMDDVPDEDFDFEGNLALFDKAAVFSQIDSSERRGNGARSRGTPGEQTPSRYRHDENILEAKPVVYRQIMVPQNGTKEYSTASLSTFMVCLWSAGLWGFNRNCTIKNIFSRSGCHWSGFSRRLTPKNVHQRPTVALLCGPHVQGAQGISCGRHLANHEVEVILFLPNFVKMLEAITSELALFGKTGGKLVSNVKDLPETPVDLVINCLDSHENGFLREQPWYKAAADWANQNRAPVLSIDPPVSGQAHAVEAKWSLSLGLPLPLSEGAGRVYLCDIGIPRQVFQEVGIKYHSPFGCKFVIPLHSE